MDDSMTPTEDVLLRFDDKLGHRSVVLEDDGRVAYAYLLNGDSEIVGDAWLYNVGDDPEEVSWQDRSSMPFQNPAKYCVADRPPRLRPDSRIACTWTEQGVTVSVEGIEWVRLEVGCRPGWSLLARIPGPLAKPLRRS